MAILPYKKVAKLEKNEKPPLLVTKSVKPKDPVTIPEWDKLEALGIKQAQVKKAVEALIKHLEKEDEEKSNDLLGDSSDEKFLLTVGLTAGARRDQHKPIRLNLAHPAIDPRQQAVTLFVKDPQRHYKNLLEEQKVTFINRVIGVEKLRGKHKTLEAKRALLKEADLFLVDDRVTFEVGKSLGKMWRKARKQPGTVNLTKKNVKAELEKAVAATYLQINMGSSLAVKFGIKSVHSSDELVENAISLIPQVLAHVPDGIDNVVSLHIKSTHSIALPIYQKPLDSLFAEKPDPKQEKELKQKLKEKELKEQAKEKARAERSATKTGKGRYEKAIKKSKK